jgi:molybdopterin converting factor small subunit
MKINIKTFGALTDLLEDTEIEVNDGATLRDLKHTLLEQFPQLKQQYFRMAIGVQMSEENTQLIDGDEVSLMPPFSGG